MVWHMQFPVQKMLSGAFKQWSHYNVPMTVGHFSHLYSALVPSNSSSDTMVSQHSHSNSHSFLESTQNLFNHNSTVVSVFLRFWFSMTTTCNEEEDVGLTIKCTFVYKVRSNTKVKGVSNWAERGQHRPLTFVSQTVLATDWAMSMFRDLNFTEVFFLKDSIIHFGFNLDSFQMQRC